MNNKSEVRMNKREEVNRKAREKYATNVEYRERCKAKSREATAKLDDEGRKKRAAYMREYHKKHPEYLKRKRENEKSRRERLKEQNNVQ